MSNTIQNTSKHSIVCKEQVDRFNKSQEKMGIPKQTLEQVNKESIKQKNGDDMDIIDSSSMQEMIDLRMPEETRIHK